MKKLTESNNLKVVYVDGKESIDVVIPTSTLKHLILDWANEKLTIPDCNESTCAVNNFCECDPINENFEFAGIYLEVKS